MTKYEQVWEEIVDSLIALHVDEVITEKELKWLREDIELVVSDLKEDE